MKFRTPPPCPRQILAQQVGFLGCPSEVLNSPHALLLGLGLGGRGAETPKCNYLDCSHLCPILNLALEKSNNSLTTLISLKSLNPVTQSQPKMTGL